jgi:hypothetical protein
MTAMVEMPSPEEMARVDAWREERRRIAEERSQAMYKRRVCSLHGPGPTGRMLYGPAPYGYGPVCKFCRREWSRRNGGKPWESAEQAYAREKAEHDAMVAEIEAMPPAEFYVAWEALRAKRHEATKRYHREAKPDEFGVNNFGSATPDGERYRAMRERVWRERRSFEEARDVI